MLRVGVDVGGTNTDAAVMDGARLLGSNKSPTTPDVTSGIVAAVSAALAAAKLPASALRAVMIGTTHFTNAGWSGGRRPGDGPSGLQSSDCSRMMFRCCELCQVACSVSMPLVHCWACCSEVSLRGVHAWLQADPTFPSFSAG